MQRLHDWPAAELSQHLGHEKGDPGGSGNSRNGYSSKTVLTEEDQLELEIPRDRAESFEPQLVPKEAMAAARSL